MLLVFVSCPIEHFPGYVVELFVSHVCVGHGHAPSGGCLPLQRVSAMLGLRPSDGKLRPSLEGGQQRCQKFVS